MRHGLLAEVITEFDRVDYDSLISDLNAALQPEGPIEKFLAERIGLCMVRLKRATQLEAGYITEELNSPFHQNGQIDAELPTPLPHFVVEHLVSKFQRYETAVESKFYRAVNQLERLQRMRLGQQVVAPAVVQVDIHNGDSLASFGNCATEEGADR